MTTDALQQMVEQNHEMAEAGHQRLRNDYRSLEGRVTAIETARVTIDRHIERLDSQIERPIEISTLRFTPQIVLLIVSTCITVAGGMWASTYGLRSDVRDILTHMAAQEELEKANIKLQDERANTLKATIDMIDKKQELQRLKLESITETVLRLQR